MIRSTNPYDATGLLLIKGETHLHTLHSDGRDTPRAMLDACQRAGYGFVAITDHNTISGVDEAKAAADALGLIVLSRLELTTFHGHAVCLGVEHVPEWRALDETGVDPFVRAVHDQAGLFCVSHPLRLGSPVCSGCAWEWQIQATSVDLWEIFSGGNPEPPHPEMAELAWREVLAASGHAAPVAAGDVHAVSAAEVSRPATFVYAADATAASVLMALKAACSFASRGPRLDFWLAGVSGAVLVGGVTPWSPDLRPQCALDGGPVGTTIQIVATPAHTTRHSSVAELDGEVPLPRVPGCVYARAEAPDGSLVALTSPIWIT